jgi:hypothetical protein
MMNYPARATGADPTAFNRGAVQTMAAMSEGWKLVKDQYGLFFGITLVGMLIAGAVPLGLFLGPVYCGFNYCFLKKLRGERVEFANLFKGVDHFGASFVPTLFLIGPAIVLILPAYFFFFFQLIQMTQRRGPGQPPDGGELFSLLGPFYLFIFVVAFILAFVNLLLMFSYPLIVDRKLGGMQSVKTSISASFANLGGLLGLFFMHILISIPIAALTCGFGVYLYLPVSLASYAVAYRQVFAEIPELWEQPKEQYPSPYPPAQPGQPPYGRPYDV